MTSTPQLDRRACPPTLITVQLASICRLRPPRSAASRTASIRPEKAVSVN
ncbi:hypothetical protein ACIU1J_16650 [Azospirillum doebereinerae]